MKNLIQICSKKVTPVVKPKRKYKSPLTRGKHIAYKINNYIFWLNIAQWAEFLNINRTTISHRFQKNRPIDIVLGFTKEKRGRK